MNNVQTLKCNKTIYEGPEKLYWLIAFIIVFGSDPKIEIYINGIFK